MSDENFKRITMKKIFYFISILMIGAVSALTSCSDSKTYAELLADEKSAIRYFISEQKISAITISEEQLEDYLDKPKDKLFKTDQWYKFSSKEDMYMNIHKYGNIEEADTFQNRSNVILRYEACYNLLEYDNMTNSTPENNLAPYEYLEIELWTPNYSGDFGVGLAFPVQFLGDGAVVSLIVPSKAGTVNDASSVVPRYFKNLTYKVSNR